MKAYRRGTGREWIGCGDTGQQPYYFRNPVYLNVALPFLLLPSPPSITKPNPTPPDNEVALHQNYSKETSDTSTKLRRNHVVRFR